MKRILAGILMVLVGCTRSMAPGSADVGSHWLHSAHQKLTEIIVHDIFSPPVACRVYAYTHIAAYEALAADPSSGISSLAGKVKGLNKIPSAKLASPAEYQLAAFVAMQTVGAELVFSVDEWNQFCNETIDSLYQFDTQHSRAAFESAKKFGSQVAKHILQWAGGDNYRESRSFPKFTVSSDVGQWQPTPPAYMDAVEPHWGRIRTMLLDSAGQFAPKQPAAFSVNPGSDFYRYAFEVYEMQRDSSKVSVANFWDCNPFALKFSGHLSYAAKKITPGGHWLAIAGIVCASRGASLYQTSKAYTWLSISLFDSFIACWHQKFKSKLIRPETYINKYIDPDWKPVLQTPPFPEYTSGHSVVSAASARVLASLFSDSVRYVDNTEVQFGLPARTYTSFSMAAREAAISRLYGGIHFRPAIDEGYRQGNSIGLWTVSKLEE